MNNIKITIRRLLKDKVFTGFSVFGLVVGISSFLVLFIHVNNEKSFDRHITDSEQIYRVNSIPEGRENSPWARSLGMVHQAAPDISEVEMATQFTYCSTGELSINEVSFGENEIMSVDESFFKMFGIKMKLGNPADINKPNVVFISEEFARKYFENENPVGQTINVKALQYLNNLGEYEIRGIVKNVHPKTHFKYDLLLSQKGALQERYAGLSGMKIQWVYNYFKLHEGSDPQAVEDKLSAHFSKSRLTKTRGPQKYSFSLFPMRDIHLKSDFRFELRESSSKVNIVLYMLIAFVILSVSLLNFINLTISKLIKRSKELGMRKAIGADRTQLLKQVLIEVFLVCLCSIAMSFLFIEAIKPAINNYFDIDFEIFYAEPIVISSVVAVIGLCLVLTTLFVGGFFIARKSTMSIISNQNNFSGSYVLKTLLLIQVAVVVVLISSTMLVNKQINFVLNQPLGYEKDNVMVVHIKNRAIDPAVFANELKKQSQVVAVGMTAQHFGYPSQDLPLTGFDIDGSAAFVFSNYDYLQTMNIKLIENWISPSADTVRGMLVNNHLYKRLMARHGSIENLRTYLAAQPDSPNTDRIEIIGVMEDFNYSSAHVAVGDFAFYLDESRNRGRFVHICLNSGNLHASVGAIKNIWTEHYPNQEFTYFFLDEKVAQQYKAETMLRKILLVFTFLGFLISVIGISALALFIAQQRTKEIGIRKVNGARVSEILAMLNFRFIKWVGIAFIVACPVAYYLMQKWLENFAYKTTLSWWIFALAGAIALGIAIVTVSWQSWRAASKNPVESLRYE